ncbi:heterogeneous nuclear ribonucleoprotein C-like isoform X3 [Xiphophorus couchianus]|uniref:heterogeneous nuclear ribonucleoprotein C-like isoform X3 n=2 Tax=Xiphophorus couchianus TaxID=32473 RepID=UPI0010165214|nr:heterogeneous nuclear ribonucleoprotein C-like isoform X3 [Xiphophorus couchianus]
MTLFSPRYMSMSGELKSSRSRAASKRASNTTYGSEFDLDYDSYHEDYYDRACDYQRVPASLSPVPSGPSVAKRSRSSSYSYSYSTGHRRSRDRTHSKSSRAHSTSSNTAKLGMEELQVIKKELTLIKTQIDGLLDSLDRMDTQKNDHKESPLREDSPLSLSYVVTASSPEHSLSSLSPPSSRHRIHRESPDMKMSSHSSDPEEEI